MQYKYTLGYILSILLVNIGFVYIQPIPLLGEMFPPMSIIVGFIFILRDFAQREIGHKVLGAMAVGADGLIVECHPNPSKSISDPDQAIGLKELVEIEECVNG